MKIINDKEWNKQTKQDLVLFVRIFMPGSWSLGNFGCFFRGNFAGGLQGKPHNHPPHHPPCKFWGWQLPWVEKQLCIFRYLFVLTHSFRTKGFVKKSVWLGGAVDPVAGSGRKKPEVVAFHLWKEKGLKKRRQREKRKDGEHTAWTSPLLLSKKKCHNRTNYTKPR